MAYRLPADPAARQFLVILAGFLACSGAAWVGAGTPSKLLFILFGVATAAYYRRHSPWLFITATLWFWTFTPLMRRIIDYRGGFDPTNMVLATPNIMAAFMVLDIVRDRALLRRSETVIGMLVLLPMLYGLSVSFLSGQMLAGAVASMDWIIPLLYYFYIVSHADSVLEASGCLRVFLALNGLLTAAYAIIQSYSPPNWDVAWVLATRTQVSENSLESTGFPLFGSLNTTGFAAYWFFALIVLSLHFRTRLSAFIVPATGYLLLLTNVRSVTVATIGAVLLAGLVGDRRVLAPVLAAFAAVALVGVTVGSFDPALTDRLTARFGNTDLQTDDSWLQRATIVSRSPALIDRYPFGIGIGAIGRGAVVSSDADLVSVDFGPLAVFLSLGWVGGMVYLGGLCVVVGHAAFSAIRSRSAVAIPFSVLALGMVGQMTLVNVIAFQGMILWLASGFAIAYSKSPPQGRA